MTEAQTPDTKPGPYYVSCVDAGKVFLMAGPYDAHAQALADVDKACRIASDCDGRAWFAEWGTLRIEGGQHVGRLNTLGLMS